jgi:hypothetical protein
MKDEVIVKLSSFTLIAIMYIVTVFRVPMSPDVVQAIWTGVIGVITSVVGYNLGKTVAKKKAE